MSKPTPAQLLPTYHANLARYLEEGRTEQADTQRRLIERLEAAK